MIRWKHGWQGGPDGRPVWSRVLAALVLVAHLSVLGNSPIEQGWDLAVHLVKDHHAGVRQVSVHHDHEHGSTQRHASEQHEHDGAHQAMFAGTDLDGIQLPVAPNMPHEHQGRVHTHEQSPTEHPFLLTVSLAKFYLFSNPLPSSPPPARDHGWVRSVAAPLQITLSVETPPPRLPG